MNIFIAGNGRVGTALKNFLKKNGFNFLEFDKTLVSDDDVVFLAVSDNVVELFVEKISSVSCYVFYFSGSKPNLKNATLIHPFASISKETDLSEITFTLSKTDNASAKEVLRFLGFKFIEHDINSIAYHTSAVLSGNFSQFFYLAAKKLLKDLGFSDFDADVLIKQLIITSLENVSKLGKQGITGPAIRNDLTTIKKEIEFLNSTSPNLAEIYALISKEIAKKGKK